MKLSPIIFLAFLLLASTSCKKSSDSANDYASKVIGTYGGAVPPGIISGNLVLSRKSNTEVNIERSASGGFFKHYGIATVSDGGEGKYNISLATNSDTIIGVANDSLFKCHINSWYFYGIKR
jgi:hypothetical protein